MVDWAVVDWSDRTYRFDKIDSIDEDGHFYAIMSGLPGKRRGDWEDTKLLYVGVAFRQHVVTRMKQDHSAYSSIVRYIATNRKRDLLVMIGGVLEHSAQRLRREFVEHIESLLIFRNKPRFNVRSTGDYRGRDLVVINSGYFEPLKRTSACCTTHRNDLRDSGEFGLARSLTRE